MPGRLDFQVCSFHSPVSNFQFLIQSSINMAAEHDDQFVIDYERQVLRALCQGALDRRAGLNTLRSYRWREPLHQVIFDFLVSMPGANLELMREQLPTHLTLRGFPDFDLTWFQCIALAETDIERLMQRLRLTETRFD
jgi:hypothetical protein